MTEPFDEERTKEDLRSILTDYWLGVLENPKQKPEYQLKSSEMLAKYILGEGRNMVNRRQGPPKPSTADILKFAEDFEKRLEAEGLGDDAESTD